MIIEAILIMSGLGFIFGFILSYASKKLEVKVDTVLQDLIGCLPGVNCGACGYPSCKSYAEAVFKEECAKDLCKVGKKPVEDKINEIMLKKKTS